ncbi:hypothetical protein [Hyalangium rubrum]|uniref:Uncharacterized protein n=1 Tax=Hyalangium rubrum TaxID=3103134 RepID=A0ABU5HCS3_9BACT|nr:hypothetical protein [Hyalangium sp. s54d21]MDY7231257.1 hypothetical protein [Hyalangium sp. s54d21]
MAVELDGRILLGAPHRVMLVNDQEGKKVTKTVQMKAGETTTLKVNLHEE